MQEYNPAKIEPRWQKFWEKTDLYKARDFSKKPKIFLLVEFPYPSGAGLHVGHCRSYTALDIIARKKRMEGYNVLFPMGWDAFGLPTENYALKTGIHPKIVTKQNTAVFKRQEKQLGLSFDWSREINTTDPDYYKWTQRIFLKLFEKGLAYQAEIPVNWCPRCKTNLADEEVLADASHERCGMKTERRMQKQWLIKITSYGERLLKDLDLVDFRDDIKLQQKNWIGRKKGINIVYPIKDSPETITVFTTRPDTNFGATFVVLSPEHHLAEKIATDEFKEEVRKYIQKAKNKSELERISEGRKKTGVFTGRYAINQLNGCSMPIWVSDFVLSTVGTGALVGVPGHDKRDFEFAKEFNLPIVRVVAGKDGDTGPIEDISQVQEEEGIMVNSGFLNGIDIHAATNKIMDYMEKQGYGKKAVSYHLRDWVFSRQHYWGEPIPLVFCENCAEKLKIKEGEFNKGELLNPGWVAIPEKDLPVKLPYVKKYQPSETGASPLFNIKEWVNTKCPRCGGSAKRETDTMPNWAGSNWYYLAYAMRGNQKLKIKNQNDKSKFKNGEYVWDKEKMKYWMPVDWYNGGMEHTTLHLLYSRFIYKFLWDIGEAPKELIPEPYKKRTSHGMILGDGRIKMSKSKCNVINPETVVKEYGADALRVYEMFMGPFEQAIAWDTQGLKGVYRFLVKIYKLQRKAQSAKRKANEVEKILHKTIKKVSEDIEGMKFNTAVSALMIFVNEIEKEKEVPVEIFKKFLLILSPFAPHLAEELYQNQKSKIKNQNVIQNAKSKEKKSIFEEKWPEYSLSLIQEEKINLVVQVNGRVRDVIEVERGIKEAKAKEFVLQSPKIKQWLYNKEIKKVIFVQDKLLNFVIDFV